MANELVEQLVQHGEVRRGQLGIALQDLTPQLAEAFGLDHRRGAVVSQVVPGSPAERAGLRPGDVVVGVNGKLLRGVAQLRNVVGLHRIGETIRLDVVRDGAPLTLRLEVAAVTVAEVRGKDVDRRLEGAVLGDLDPGHPLYGSQAGVLISELERGSPAWGNGLRKGDLILSINRRPVASVADLGDLETNEGQLLLNLQRGRRALFILLN
jgi:serine protease Do/serine protease DegQ